MSHFNLSGELYEFFKENDAESFFGELVKFSRSLDYITWNELQDNTFRIFTIPQDAESFATQLPDNNWAVWNDEGQPPLGVTDFFEMG